MASLKKLGPALVCLLVSARADAHVLELFGQLRGGGSTGKGVAGDQKDTDFFAKAEGATYGLLVGVEVLWIDVWIEHDQFTDFKSVNGTWTQFMVGGDFNIALSDPPAKGEPPKWYLNMGIGAGFGLGTGQQIMPPLDNAQVSDKGFMAEAKIGIEYRTSEAVALGVTVPVTYGYMFKNDAPANDPSNQYQSVHAQALLYLQLKFGIK